MEKKKPSPGKETGLWRQNNPAAQAAFDDSPSFCIYVPVCLFAYLGHGHCLFDYNPGLGFQGSEFVGLRHFSRFFQTVILEIFCATPWRSAF